MDANTQLYFVHTLGGIEKLRKILPTEPQRNQEVICLILLELVCENETVEFNQEESLQAQILRKAVGNFSQKFPIDNLAPK